jgi:hypothetical protein
MFIRQLRQWHPNERITRLRNLAWIITGIYLSRSVHLPHIARKWPILGKLPSLVNRLHRFLKNPRFEPDRLYLPLVVHLLQTFSGLPIHLAIDVTKVGFNHRALVVGVCYRKRTLPLAWSVHKGRIGNVAVSKQIALLNYVYQLVPSNCSVHLVGDAGFRTSDLLQWLREYDWGFVIRQPGNTHVRTSDAGWVELNQIPIREGQTIVVGWVWIAKSNPFGPVWLVLHWQKGEADPWFLVSDQPNLRPLLAAYRRRMWIEEMFGDMKRHGFDLEATHLHHAQRIERLMLAVCIAFVWLFTLGAWVVKNGHRHFIDLKSRRDKCYFRLGWDWIDHSIRLELPLRLHFKPYLSK